MADELKISYTVSFSKDGANFNRSKTITIDVSGDSYTSGVQNIGTTEESLTLVPDLTTPGFVILTNLDATNYVEIGSTTGVYDIKLKPGESVLYRHNSSTIYAKANTAAINLEYTVVED
ncbi:MAG: hypothetical protein ACWGQW_00300 [bacterium]